MQSGEEAVLGVITGCCGLRGWLRVRSFTDPPERICEYRGLRLRAPDGEGLPSIEILEMKAVPDRNPPEFLCRLSAIEDRGAAERFRGYRITTERSSLPTPAKDQFYRQDLLGMSLVNATGVLLGHVIAAHDFGAGDILEIKLHEGIKRLVMVPFTREIFSSVDLANGKITVREEELEEWIKTAV